MGALYRIPESAILPKSPVGAPLVGALHRLPKSAILPRIPRRGTPCGCPSPPPQKIKTATPPRRGTPCGRHRGCSTIARALLHSGSLLNSEHFGTGISRSDKRQRLLGPPQKLLRPPRISVLREMHICRSTLSPKSNLKLGLASGFSCGIIKCWESPSSESDH